MRYQAKNGLDGLASYSGYSRRYVDLLETSEPKEYTTVVGCSRFGAGIMQEEEI